MLKKLTAIIFSIILSTSHITSSELIEDQSLRNLTALAHLAGYVDYFYPREPFDAYTLETFVTCYASYVEAAETDEQLIKRLNAVFEDGAALVHVYPTDENIDVPSELLAPPDTATHINKKVHFATSLPSPPYRITAPEMLRIGLNEPSVEYVSSNPIAQLFVETIMIDRPNPADPFRVELVDGISAMVPIALYADESGTFPREPSIFFFECPFEVDERSRNIALVTGAYNAMKFYFPYWDRVDLNWEDSLSVALTGAMASFTTAEGNMIVKQMMILLNDGHIFVPYSPTTNRASSLSLPINWDIIDEQLVITAVFDELPIIPGDIVLSIDGQPAIDIVEATISTRSGSPQYRKYQALRLMLTGHQRGTVELEIMRQNGAVTSVQISSTYNSGHIWNPHEIRPNVIDELGDGIVYVDLTRLTVPILEDMLDLIMGADALVLDMRGYVVSHAPHRLLTSFTDQTIQYINILTPVRLSPNELRFYDASFPYPYSNEGTHFEGQVAWLIAGYTASQAESLIGIAERNNLGVFVGQTTAGTNGNLASMHLGDLYVSWTSRRVLKADGSPINNNGFVTDIVVDLTLEDI